MQSLNALMFEGFLAGEVAAGGQLTVTTTTDLEDFPSGIGGWEFTELLRE